MIQITNATKRYGETAALNNISLEIKKPGIYCLLGRNGAGKTTLLKSCAGHINLSEGEIYVNGERINTLNMPARLNFMEAQSNLFNMRIKDLIKYAAMLSDDFDKGFAEKTAVKFKLDLNKKYKQLSFGMKTMVSTLISLAGNNSIVMLDEPVLGLDAIMRERFYLLLQESIEAYPRVIIVSTHLIDEIGRVAENIIIIDKGKILDYFNISEMDEKGYCITGMTADVEKAVKGLKVISKKTIGGFTTASIFDKRVTPPANCTVQSIGLQDYFVALVGGSEYEN